MNDLLNEFSKRIDRDGGPVVPQTIDLEGDCKITSFGLSVRDYFAAQALIGILGARNGLLVDVGTDNVSGWAYDVADKMLQERKRKEADNETD